MPNQNFDNSNTRQLFVNWVMSIGSLAFLCAISPFCHKLWLPAIVIGLQYILLVRVKHSRESQSLRCSMLPYVTTRILFFTAVIMVFINLYYMKFIDPQEYVIGTANRRIPYITVLILGPVTFLVCSWASLRRDKLLPCKECRARYGAVPETGFVGRVNSSESRFQLEILLVSSLVISVYAWIYYYWHYSNVNFNSTDKFIYNFSSPILFLISTGYFAFRYFSLSAFYIKEVLGDKQYHASSTLVRFLILCKDSIFLYIPDKKSEPDKKVDTPASVFIPYREHLSPHDVYDLYYRLNGKRESGAIKFLYENSRNGAEYNILHYVCTVDAPERMDGSDLHGKWYTRAAINSQLATHPVSPLLHSEMQRLYTVTMAFKTYDREGHRLYGIKNYHPGFTFDDISNQPVDFNDPVWLEVAENNEDKKFYKMKKLWRRYIDEF